MPTQRKRLSALRIGSCDSVVANRPFGAKIVIDDQQIGEQSDLAARLDRETDDTWSMHPRRTARATGANRARCRRARLAHWEHTCRGEVTPHTGRRPRATDPFMRTALS